MTAAQLRNHIETHEKWNSWWLNDAMGIPLCRVCDTCIETRKQDYAPEVLGERGRYTDVVEERIEGDDL
jgi:hypothetical protein